MNDWLLRFVRRVGVFQLVTVGLLWAAFASVAQGVSEVVRGLEVSSALAVVTGGTAVGWWLGTRTRPLWLVGAALLIGESLLIGGWVGRLGALVGTLTLSLFRLGDGPTRATARAAWAAWGEVWLGVGALGSRLREWLLAQAAGAATFDPIAASLVWAMALWLVAAWAGWVVRRRRAPLPALLPAALLLLGTRFLAGGDEMVVLGLVGPTLFLVVLVGQRAREERWEADGWDYSREIRNDFLMVALTLCSGLIVVAAAVPSLSVQEVARAFLENVEGSSVNPAPVFASLGLEPPPRPVDRLAAVRVPGLPRQHLLEAGPDLSEQVVMLIQTDDAPPVASEPPPRYGWRGLTYDRYSGRGWSTGRTRTTPFEANTPLVAEVPLAHRPLRQRVQVRSDVGGVLHAAGVLVAAGTPTDAAFRSNADLFGATVAVQEYAAEVAVPEVAEAQLRAAGNQYPRWVRERYLALPENLPERVRSLAYDLTATAPTPYARARAIESYLRGFPYSLDLPLPPAGRDVADFFLFDLRRGYCDYYATAMVVLARAAGIPARMAVGYASGGYDASTGQTTVTEADAHSWPELYFPLYGWIAFEPTASQPGLNRASSTDPSAMLDTPEGAASWVEPFGERGWGEWLLGVPIVALVGGGGWLLLDGWRLRRLLPQETVARLYGRLAQSARWLGVPVATGATPSETASALTGAIRASADGPRWARLLSPATDEVQWLLALYVRVAYGAYHPDAAVRKQAVALWARLRLRLWLVALLRHGLRHKRMFARR